MSVVKEHERMPSGKNKKEKGKTLGDNKKQKLAKIASISPRERLQTQKNNNKPPTAAAEGKVVVGIGEIDGKIGGEGSRLINESREKSETSSGSERKRDNVEFPGELGGKGEGKKIDEYGHATLNRDKTSSGRKRKKKLGKNKQNEKKKTGEIITGDRRNSESFMAPLSPEGEEEIIEENHSETETPHSPLGNEETTSFRTEIADMPMEDVLKLRESLGSKLYSKLIHGSEGPQTSGNPVLADTELASRASNGKTEFKRKSRKRPREMSAKWPISTRKNAFPTLKKERWDPRFYSETGDYSEIHFKQNYRFLKDLQAEEKEILREEIEETEDQEKVAEMSRIIECMENRKRAEDEKQKKKQKLKKLRKANMERMKEGKRPVFLKKSELKREELDEKYAELKRKGKLEKYLRRKEKKKRTKNHNEGGGVEKLQFEDE